jgi:integrase/recombinase XerC
VTTLDLSSTPVQRLGLEYVSERLTAGEITPATARTYKETLGLFSEAVGPYRLLSSIEPHEIRDWLEGLTEHSNLWTTRIRLSTVRVFYGWAILNGIVTRDATSGVRAPQRRLVKEREASDASGPTALEVLAAVTPERVPEMPLEVIGFDYVTGRVRRQEITPRTSSTFREVFRLFVQFLGPDKPISAISRRDIERWIEHMNVAPATVRLRIGTLRNFFQWAVVNGYLTADPTLGLRAPRLPRRLPRAVPPKDIAVLLECCPDTRAELMVLLMCQEGLRAIEISRLEEGDVDFDHHLIRVRGKGGHERILPVSDETWSALVDYLSEFPTTAGPLIRSYRVGRDGKGAPILAPRVSAIVGCAMQAAGIGRSPHRLRHTMATDMFHGGANVREVQAALGHVSLATTQVYLPLMNGAELRKLMAGRQYRAVPAEQSQN